MAGEKSDERQRIVSTNRLARRDFEILDTVEAGIVLQGSEVKALREAGRTQLNDAYARIRDGEAWLVGMHIAPYSHAAAAFSHEPERSRKLLLRKDQILRLASRIDQQGLTLVPLSLYFRSGRAKVELGLARRRRKADKRQALAKREADREARAAVDRAMKRG